MSPPIKITPEPKAIDHYTFRVEVEVDGESRSIPKVEAEDVLNFDKFQAIVARQTGCLLKLAGTWELELAKAWQHPEPQPDRSDELEDIDRSGEEPGNDFDD